MLEDEHQTVWPLDVAASREIARYRGDQTIRLVRRDEAAADTSQDVGGDAADDEDDNVQGLLKMLGSDGKNGADAGALAVEAT